MTIFCLEDFKVAYEKLISKKSYRSLEKEIIDYFFATDIDLTAGPRLNGSSENPFIKKRLGGSGKFRMYFYVVVKDDNLYLMFVHPKSGSKGSSNITDDHKKQIYKDVLEAIRTNEGLYSLTVHENCLVFKEVLD